MKVAIYTDYDKVVRNDLLFTHDKENNEYIFLQKALLSLGHELHTLDVYFKNKISFDVCLFLDMPKKIFSRNLFQNARTLLYIREIKI